MSSTGMLLLGVVCSGGPLAAQGPEAPDLPKPYATKSAIHFPKVIGWSEGHHPKAPEGFEVRSFTELENPRWFYVLPNGDVLVAQENMLFYLSIEWWTGTIRMRPTESNERMPLPGNSQSHVANGMLTSRRFSAPHPPPPPRPPRLKLNLE